MVQQLHRKTVQWVITVRMLQNIQLNINVLPELSITRQDRIAFLLVICVHQASIVKGMEMSSLMISVTLDFSAEAVLTQHALVILER